VLDKSIWSSYRTRCTCMTFGYLSILLLVLN
jgi:hypothetical protein